MYLQVSIPAMACIYHTSGKLLTAMLNLKQTYIDTSRFGSVACHLASSILHNKLFNSKANMSRAGIAS